jgi:hypothetical protein
MNEYPFDNKIVTGRYGNINDLEGGPTRNSNAGVAPATPSDLVYAADGSGMVIHSGTKNPFTGVNPFDGKTYKNGREVVAPAGKRFIPGTTTAIDPNNPNERYKGISIDKNPDVAKANDSLLEDFKKSASTSMSDFGSYLNDFKTQIGNSNSMGKSAVSNTIDSANNLQIQQSRYSGALDNAVSHASQGNEDASAREAAILKQMQDNNTVGMNNALTASERMQLGQLNNQVSRYKMAGGTPRSLGSDELAMQASGARSIAVPIELQRVQNEQNILQGTALPIAQQDAARTAQFWQNFVPGVAGTQYQSGQQTTQEIQKLKSIAATMSYDNAIKYMQSIGVPAQIQQQILSGQIGNLGGINQLYSSSRYQGLQDVLGANVAQPQQSSFSAGGLPPSRYGGDAPVAYSGQQTDTGTNGYDPTFDKRLADVNALNASRYVPNPSKEFSPNIDTSGNYPANW